VAETIGSLIDKLSIVNIKLYVVQDRVHEAAEQGIGLDKETVARLASLNKQRNKLMTEIEQSLDDAIKAGGLSIDPRPKL
jgi:hypothetical protein